jgi:hypothetical protein
MPSLRPFRSDQFTDMLVSRVECIDVWLVVHWAKPAISVISLREVLGQYFEKTQKLLGGSIQ